MTAREIIDEINRGAFTPPITCDTVKWGDPEREVGRLGICMMPTVEVLREAMRRRVDMLIVHEPIYYNHMDELCNDPVTEKKASLVRELDAVIYRYHDNMHYRPSDLIGKGELQFMGLSGETQVEPGKPAVLHLSKPMTAPELGELAKERLGLKNLKIAGSLNGPIRAVGLCFGTPAGVLDLMKREDVECVMVGEACEWQLCEYARDADSLGITKSVIVMGHIGSERDGMKLLAEDLAKKHPDIEISYIECGEVYN